MIETMFVKRNPIRGISAGVNSSPAPPVNVAIAHIRVGSYYEIDSSILPQRSPEQLKTIRIVMVSKITGSDVSLRYPSIYSLTSHFDFRGSNMMNRTKPENKSGGSLLPVLDESHAVAVELAGELLYRRIPPYEVSVNRNSWGFWVSAASCRSNNFSRREMVSQPANNTRLSRAISPDGKCWSELRSRGMIKWGKRLRVRYQSRHIDYKKMNKDNSRLKEEADEEQICKEEMEEDDANGTEGTDHGLEKYANDGIRKRKLIESRAERLAKRAKVFDQKIENQIVVYKRTSGKKLIEEMEEDEGNETEGTDDGPEKDANDTRKPIEYRAERLAQRTKVSEQKKENQIVVYKRRPEKKFIDRWSVERYKLAEKNMLKVMKEKNAVFGNSILRSELRSEARKLIGDTGLLDHLLKHMAGKVAPGGQDRFRRRHNADGAMEYWLESSDLVNIRKEAGVEDPYWTPPPGWKIGDNPTQDPVCAGEIREIREGLASLKREMEKLASKKYEEELAIMTTPNSCVTSQNVDHDNLMTPAKEIYADLLKKKYKIEDQLMIIAETLRKMEEDMGCLKRTVDENYPRKPDSTEMPLLLEDSPRMNTVEGEVKEVNKENQITESPQKGKRDDVQEERSPLSLINNTGFRICRPVASFSWPKLPSRADEFASSPSHRPSTTAPHCPVKPLAAKRPLVLPFPFTIGSQEAPTNLFNL